MPVALLRTRVELCITRLRIEFESQKKQICLTNQLVIRTRFEPVTLQPPIIANQYANHLAIVTVVIQQNAYHSKRLIGKSKDRKMQHLKSHRLDRWTTLKTIPRQKVPGTEVELHDGPLHVSRERAPPIVRFQKKKNEAINLEIAVRFTSAGENSNTQLHVLRSGNNARSFANSKCQKKVLIFAE